MRKATFAKLSLTAAVGIGTLFGVQGTAQADDVKFIPAPPTTIKPIEAFPVDPEPDPPFDPDLPIVLDQPDEECDFPCDKAPVPQPDPEPECQPHLLCSDEITSDPGCDWTHGCPEDPEPECPEIVLSCDDITSDPGCQVTHGDCGGGDEGTDGGDEGTDGGDEGTDGGDEGTDGGDEGTDDGGDEPDCDDALTPEAPAEACVDTTDGETTDGGTGGGTLPRTGAEMATWALAGLGLTGVGAALKKLGKRTE